MSEYLGLIRYIRVSNRLDLDQALLFVGSRSKLFAKVISYIIHQVS